MKLNRLTAGLLSLIGFFQVTAFAQTQALDKEQRKQLAVYRIKGFMSDVSGNSDRGFRAVTTAWLGNALWDLDKSSARKAFNFAIEASDPGFETDKRKLISWVSVRETVIRIIARRDHKWALRLIDDVMTYNPETAVNSLIAGELLKEGQVDAATEFQRRSFSGRIEPFSLHQLNAFRNQDPKLGNKLFLEALENLSKMEQVNARNLLLLAAYIYSTSNKYFLSIAADPEVMILVLDLSVNDITGPVKPNIPDSLIDQFLSTAAKILKRPVTDPEQRKLYFVTAYLLAPRARIPETVADFAEIKASSITDEIQKGVEEREKRLKESQKSWDDKLKEVDVVTDVAERDVRYLRLLFELWQNKKLAEARIVLTKIYDTQMSAQLKGLIDFREGMVLLEQSQLKDVEQRAARLDGTKQAILWLSLAKAHVKSEDFAAAALAINNAIKATEKAQGLQRPQLLLNAAGQLAAFDPGYALQVLAESIKQFNALPSDTSGPFLHSEKVATVLKDKRPFMLFFSLPHLDYTFANLKPLVPSYSEEIIQRVKEIKWERLKGQAYVVLAEELVKQAKS